MISLSKCNHRFRWLNSPNVYCLVAKCFSTNCTKCIHRYFASTSAVVGASDSNDTSENVTKANFNSSLAVKIQLSQTSDISQQQTGQGTQTLLSVLLQIAPLKFIDQSDSRAKDRTQHQNANRWQSSALNRDSGKPFTRLRDRTGALRSNGREFDRDERLLMEKHRETLNTNELETIFDVVESIEWRRNVNQQTLDRMLDLLRSPKFNFDELSDRQLAILFSGTGASCVSLSAAKRSSYTERILKILLDKGVKLEIMAKNALLNVKIDNSVEVNAIDVLKDFKSSSIEPNIDTFAALSRIYALKGDVVGIVEIINHMKEAGIASDQRIIESMIYALALSDRDEQALSIIKSFSTSNQTFSEEAKLRISYANAKASKGDIDNALKIFDGVSERLRIRSKENSNLMLNILFTLLEKHDWNGAEKLKSLLNLDEDGKFSDAIEFTTVLGRIRQYRDQKEANVEGAIYLFKLLPEKYARTQRDFFKSYLFDKLKQSSDVDESIQLGVQLEQADILKNPRRILIDHALANNRARFYELYEKFLKSDEFKRLGKRAHLAYPYIVHSLNQLSNSSNEKKVEIFVHIASALFKWEQPEMRFLKQWFMEPLMKNSSVLTEVMCEICKDEKIRWNIASMVIDHLLFRNKFKEVTELLDGPLKDVHLNMSYLSGILRRIMTAANTSDDNLKIVSRVLSTGFIEDDQRYVSPVAALKIIESVLTSKSMSDDKSKDLIKVWSDFERIALSAEDITALQKTLNDAGKTNRAKMITVLKRKPKTLLRWKEAQDIDALETEAKSIAKSNNPKRDIVLQTLYSIIAEKRLAEKVLNVDSMTWLLECYSALRAAAATNGFFFEFNTKLRRTMKEALANRNIKAADKLWNIGSKSMPTMMKIAYAALLHTNRRVDDAKRVLTEIFSNAEPFDLNNISTSALLVDDRQENEAFLGLFARIFKLNAESRRRLLNGIRFREFEKLIDAGHLEEAFSFAKDISAETGRAFGQVELMGAALRIADMQLLNNVIGMVQQKHDKNAALIDFGVALLENERIEHAARIFATSGLHVSSGKLEYFVERERRAKRADVLLNLFLNLSDGTKATTVDVNNLLLKLIPLFGAERDVNSIHRVQDKIRSVSFPVNEELRNCIEKNLKKASSSPAPTLSA